MTVKEKISEIKSYLDKIYPHTEVFLHSTSDWTFLIAVILSSQAQDKVVNRVTPILFKKYPNLQALSQANYDDILNIIKIVGLGPSKSKNIIALSKILVSKYNSKLPHELKTLESLPGVGHKTATVFLAEIDNKPYIPVDTHISRISQRLGIVKKDTTAIKIQEILEKNFQGHDYINFHRQLILFGRNICLASNKRKCEICPFKFCKDRKI